MKSIYGPAGRGGRCHESQDTVGAFVRNDAKLQFRVWNSKKLLNRELARMFVCDDTKLRKSSTWTSVTVLNYGMSKITQLVRALPPTGFRTISSVPACTPHRRSRTITNYSHMKCLGLQTTTTHGRNRL